MNIKARTYIRPLGMFSEKGFDEHLKLYHKYVENVNQDYDTADVKAMDTYSANGVMLHELYFEQLSQEPDVWEPQWYVTDEMFDTLRKPYDERQDAYDDFKAEFSLLAMSKAIKNRGWVAWIYDELTDDYRLVTMDAHNEGLPYGCHVILILDMYEHAYFYDYGVEKSVYIENFFGSIDWNVIEERIKKQMWIGQTI